MKRFLTIVVFLLLLLLAGCAMGSDPAAPTDAATTAEKETEHVHVFREKVQSDEYLARAATCGSTPLYYFSCACGERGTDVFRGDPVPHAYAVTVTDAGVIERVRCTKEGCGHVEQPNAKLPAKGTFKGAFSCSDGGYSDIDSAKIFWYENCKETDFDDCVRELQDAGYVQKESYTMRDNRYALFSGEYCTLYLSFLSGEGAIRTYVGRSDDAIPAKTVARSGVKLQPALWQIDVDCKAQGDNGGMSYVLQLRDGKFIVIDGGYDTKEDADSIYRILSENKPADHEKPIVAAWFVTHLHIDHVGVIRSFANNHKDEVKVEGFYYNFPYVNISDIWPSNNKSWEERMAGFEGATLYRKLHSGMQFAFSGATVTVLCTFEDVYPLSFNSGNDTSTVFKIDVAGQTILFLADAEYGESDRMMFLSAETLKADIMQYAHHGYDKQCRAELYAKIDPETVLWPMPIVNWRDGGGEVFRPRYEGTSHKENAWIRSAATVKKIIVMAEGTTKLSLPYTPSGPRNADYNALYEAQRPKN